ncbi:MAG: hypothetical protein AAF597_04705 [Bacteroidota bacterium]
MKNNTTNLALYWSRCQTGVPVRIEVVPGAGLRLGAGNAPNSTTAPLAYARVNSPTGRLLLHFVRTEALYHQPYLQRDTLLISAQSYLRPTLARLLGLPNTHFQLRPGNYPLLTDQHFTTAAIAIIPRRLPSAEPVTNAYTEEYRVLPG